MNVKWLKEMEEDKIMGKFWKEIGNGKRRQVTTSKKIKKDEWKKHFMSRMSRRNWSDKPRKKVRKEWKTNSKGE